MAEGNLLITHISMAINSLVLKQLLIPVNTL